MAREVGPTAEGDESAGLVRPSLTIAIWTLVSRITGLGRVLLIAAVLGPTYLGNTFEAVNLIPNLVFELFTGAVFRSLLVPPLVQALHKRGEGQMGRLAGSFLGLTLAGFAVVTVLSLLAAPLVISLLASSVPDAETAAAQRASGVLLLVLVMPQVILYGGGGVGAAVLNARGRFALAAASPALENLVIMTAVALTGILFGTKVPLERVTTTHLVMLGTGATLAVLLHSSCQLLWASRVGVRIVPNLRWRNPEVALVVRRAIPSLGYAALNVGGVFVVTAVANRVAGGVVAFNAAWYFMYLPVALVARPVGVALLPRLAALPGEPTTAFAQALTSATRSVLFLVVPAVSILIGLARPLAEAVAFGAMASPAGQALLTASLRSIGLGALGESVSFLCIQAHYARGDAKPPLVAMAFRTTALVVGALAALTVEGTVVLTVLGVSVAAANIVGMVSLLRGVRPFVHVGHLLPPLARATLAALVLVVVALPVASVARPLPGQAGDVVALAVALAAGATGYLATHAFTRSEELTTTWLTLRRAFARGH